MAIQYTPITYLGEQLVQRSGDHMVSVDMSEANLADRTKRIHPASLSVPNLKYMVTQVGHTLGVLSPVYFDATDGLWKGAIASDRDTLCTHVVVYVDGDEFLVAESGTFRITHGLALGYWFLSDTVAGALVDEPGMINNPVLHAMDADTLRVLNAGELVDTSRLDKSYEAASFNVIEGGTVTGDIASVQHDNDGQVLRVNEASGGLTVDFTFTGVESFNFISMHLRYVGGANHVWNIQLYNYTTADWDTIGETIGSQDELTWFNVSVPQFQNYLNAGEVKVRFYHLPNFIATHYVIFDYVAVVASITAASPTASSITVSAPVTPDYTAALQGNNLQQVTNKVAGLQDLTYRKLYEIEITDPIAFIDITKDLEGNDLDLKVGFKVSYYLLADVDATLISGIQINGITDSIYEFTNLGRNYLIYYGSRFGCSGGIHLTLNGKNPDIIFHYRGEYGTSQPGTITGAAYPMRIRQDIESITSFRLLTDGYLAGSKIVIYGA